MVVSGDLGFPRPPLGREGFVAEQAISAEKRHGRKTVDGSNAISAIEEKPSQALSELV